MKVNMDLIMDQDKGQKDIKKHAEKNKPAKRFNIKKISAAVLIPAGLIILICIMTGFLNNIRPKGQIRPESTGYDTEIEEISAVEEIPVNTLDNTAPFAPVNEGLYTDEDLFADEDLYTNESEEIAALKKEAEDARNEAALIKQKLKNAEDMLDSSLKRESELQNKLDALNKN